MKHCEYCQFFTAKAHLARISLWATDFSTSQDVGRCCNPHFQYAVNDVEGLNYYDYEDYYADFLVGRLFGCIHFEQKKEEGPAE